MAVVLVVEDEEDTRALLRSCLFMHEVHEAADGDEGLEKMIALKPDIALVDIGLPGRDGRALLAEVRERRISPATRVIMLTALSSEQDLITAWKLGIAEYITKPFDIEHLTRVLRETLEMSHQQIAEKQRHELERANLFSKLESAFGEGGFQ